MSLFLVITLFITGCQSQIGSDQLYKQTAYYLYTQVEITTYGQLDQAVYEEIWQALDQIDQTMSMNITTSEVAQINANAGVAPVAVSEHTYSVIEKALYYSELNSAFDISIGPLVTLWGIGTDNAQVPAPADIEQALSKIDYHKVVLDPAERTVFLQDSGMMIDLGAIAKGFAADLTKDILASHNIDRAIINFGGNILTVGDKLDGLDWKIGIQNPDDSRGSYLGIIALKDRSIVTSGTYERFLEVDGQRYHHILDVNNGYPVDNDMWGISIISPYSIDGDALSTLVFAMGVSDGMQLLETLPDIECIIIDNARQIYLSSGLKDNFELTDDSFTINE